MYLGFTFGSPKKNSELYLLTKELKLIEEKKYNLNDYTEVVVNGKYPFLINCGFLGVVSKVNLIKFCGKEVVEKFIETGE